MLSIIGVGFYAPRMASDLPQIFWAPLQLEKRLRGMENSKTREQLIEEVTSLRSQVSQLAGQNRQKEQITAEMGRTFKDAPVGLCYFDAELRYVQINDFLAAINGLPSEAHIGKSLTEVLPEIAAAGVEKELRGVLESGDPVIRGTVTMEPLAHPGEEHTYMHDYYAIRAGDGEIIGVSCCVVDITGLRRAEQERDKHIREIEAFNKMAVGRELRMIELKREINELCEQIGIESKYDVSFDADTESTPKQSGVSRSGPTL